ncbi:hypothetical protein [Micromonospora carbonacea]|uniref:Uncharacterized protein n=1 Tax=Micromonospora carbonacea TaxID=47853 RepID=A0A1C5A2K9_9ACTN|nr:hypothetical protein [Micromonospora carbonacea]SCF18382.1 hypothetical protein GA0070563_1061 [Micromonospora carbonacea]SCF39274.1 hypothetical protein GA0070563_1111 [Micromonospora carbonacea]SCF41807.1 hypothetical protein GA0070563_1121 [Micromonospora carbonacea]
MTQPAAAEAVAGHPFIHIEQRPDPDDPAGFQLDVKAGDGINSTDHLVTLLLLVVENITGVSPELYAKEIDITRRLARGGPLFPPNLDHDES